MKKIAYATLFSMAVAFGSAAQAQVLLQNGATLSTSSGTTLSRTESVNTLDLSLFGAPATAGTAVFVSSTPMIQAINGTNVSLSFTGLSGVYNNTSWLPTVSVGGSRNYMLASQGSVSLDFSSAQNYFSMRWGSIDNPNNLAFYNGDELVTSVGGSQLKAILGTTGVATSTVELNFGQSGFTRVVATTTTSGFDFDRVAFASDSPEVAPLPLGSAGGLIAFLGMMGARRRGLSWRDAMREANPLRRMREARAA